MKLTKFKSWVKAHNRIVLMVSCLVLILCLGGGAAILHFSRNALPDDGSLELLLDEELENADNKIASNADAGDNDQETDTNKSDSGNSSPDNTTVSSDRNSGESTESESSSDESSITSSSDGDNNSSSSDLTENPDSETSPENPENPGSGDTNNGVIQTNHPYELPFIPVNP